MNHLIHIQPMPLVKEFLASIVSDGTRVAYARDLLLFNEFLDLYHLEVSTCSIAHLGVFREHLRKSISKNSVNRRLACLCSYFKYLVVEGVLDRNPAEYVKRFSTKDFVPTGSLSDDEVSAMFAAVNTSSSIGKLHLVVLHFLFYLGLRRAELCSLRVCSLSSSLGETTLLVHGKGGKNRTVPLSENVLLSLKSYLATRQPELNPESPLFVSSKDNCTKCIHFLHPNTIAKIVHKYATQAGIKRKISPHCARTTCVSNALENGASPLQVQYLGGWSSLEMVMRYDRRRQEIKNSAVFKINFGSK